MKIAQPQALLVLNEMQSNGNSTAPFKKEKVYLLIRSYKISPLLVKFGTLAYVHRLFSFGFLSNHVHNLVIPVLTLNSITLILIR